MSPIIKPQGQLKWSLLKRDLQKLLKNKKTALFIVVVFLSITVFLLYRRCCRVSRNQALLATTSNLNDQYKHLMDNFEKIFPKKNRNGGGPQYFKWICDNIQDSDDFVNYCKLYCPVSGSPIDPNRKDAYSVIEVENVKELIEKNKIQQTKGIMYRCCWPCVCDVKKYVKCDTFQRNDKSWNVMVINDPCNYPDGEVWNEVTSYKCENKKTKNGIFSDNGYLIVGLLHDHSGQKEDLPKGCVERMNTEPSDLVGGMGDIFVNLTLPPEGKEGAGQTKQVASSVHTPDSANEMKNVYNEPLKKCPDDSDSTKGGSWDSSQLCSELGGGVHQICYRNIGNSEYAKDFSKSTGQNSWSNDRGENNHCVCLGAWSLYEKLNNDGSSADEEELPVRLKCEAIPKIALSKQYVNKWSTWNGNELPDQIIDGVESLYDECKKDAKSDSQKIENLSINYCNFVNSLDSTGGYNNKFKKGRVYQEQCL